VQDVGELVVSCFKNSEKEYSDYVRTSNDILGTKLELWDGISFFFSHSLLIH